MSKKSVILVLFLICAVVAIAAFDMPPQDKPEKVLICHNGNTLEVSERAVPAHLSHGDTLGACVDDIDDSAYTIYLPILHQDSCWPLCYMYPTNE